ncbi:MAG: hypothetical protein OHK0046_28390 [Anaerolineae bacterium]
MFTITPLERSHRQPVLDMLFHSMRVFTHLDWQDVGQWLNTPDAYIQLAWRQQRLMGILGISPALNGCAWIRVVGLADQAPAREVLPALWEGMVPVMRGGQVHTVAALLAERWLEDFLPMLHFAYQEDIITLARDQQPLPTRKQPAVHIRAAEPDDFPQIAVVDQAAFAPPWQMTEQEIRAARRIAASCKVALHAELGLVGYQLSTLYSQSGHLARLATLPQMQAQGVGSALLEDLILEFDRRSVHHLTVNTQASNINSQKLYLRYGFHRNGYDLPVWIRQL